MAGKAAAAVSPTRSSRRTDMATPTAGSSSPPTPHADDSPEPSLPGGKVYVAVGREVAESRATLLWALHKFSSPGQGAAASCSFVLLHVYSPPKFLPISASPLLYPLLLPIPTLPLLH